MKRKDLEKEILAAGFTIHTGKGGHDKIKLDGKYASTLPRHREIPEGTVRAIRKQLIEALER